MTEFSLKKALLHKVKKKADEHFNKKSMPNRATNWILDGSCHKKLYQKWLILF
jgi:hypothetical protein